MISKGRPTYRMSVAFREVSEVELVRHYLGVKKIPSLINSPLRQDSKPSFSIYRGRRGIKFFDFATGDKGSIYDLLMIMFNKNFKEVMDMINQDFHTKIYTHPTYQKNGKTEGIVEESTVDIKVAARDWMPHDIEYWESFGISQKWLKYADVYPISHKVVYKNNERYVFKADKYAYVFVEFKEQHTTLKIYQPFNKKYKWCNKHDRSVISLWTKVPKSGDKLCVCSSLKDALCLWSNLGIPSIAIQGEGYSMSNTAINNLKSRFKEVYILLDNDKAGLQNAEKLAKETGFINVVLPPFEGGKDISDLYKYNKQLFFNILNNLFYGNSFRSLCKD
jgi:hypothetical protein